MSLLGDVNILSEQVEVEKTFTKILTNKIHLFVNDEIIKGLISDFFFAQNYPKRFF